MVSRYDTIWHFLPSTFQYYYHRAVLVPTSISCWYDRGSTRKMIFFQMVPMPSFHQSFFFSPRRFNQIKSNANSFICMNVESSDLGCNNKNGTPPHHSLLQTTLLLETSSIATCSWYWYGTFHYPPSWWVWTYSKTLSCCFPPRSPNNFSHIKTKCHHINVLIPNFFQ